MKRRSHITAILLAGAAMALVSVSAQSAARKVVRDVHYGEVLFHFYDQDYFPAISHLAAYQKTGRIREHTKDAELLLGGMYLSYGLHVEAEKIFRRLLDEGASGETRSRAWFYLGKILYQRDYRDKAHYALVNARGALPHELEQERRVLLSLLLIEKKQYAQALSLLDTIEPGSEWSSYARYNAGVALIKQGQIQQGEMLLTALGAQKMRTDEMRALRDKANVALAYTLLSAGQAQKAQGLLEKVRLEGPQSNKALLGMGWSLTSLGQHDAALVPWLALQSRHVIDPAVQESLLAIPYALGKQGQYQEAVAHYETAIQTYQTEIDRLNTVIAGIRRGKLQRQILRQHGDDSMGWFWELKELSDNAEQRYLMHLLAQNDFHESLKNYRDLVYLDNNLRRWQGDLDVFEVMLAARKQRYRERLPVIQRHAREVSGQSFASERKRHADSLARVEQQDDFRALATDHEVELGERLEQVRRQVERMPRGSAKQEARERYRRLKGILDWRVASDYGPRLWQARKTLIELDQAIDDQKRAEQSFERTRLTAPAAFSGFDKRIRGLSPQIDRLRAEVGGLLAEQNRYLQGLAIAELRKQQQRLRTYLSQARFGVAQIYDMALEGGK